MSDSNKASSDIFKQIFDSLPEPHTVFRTDKAMTIVALNASAITPNNLPRETILGRPLHEVYPDNPETAPEDRGSVILPASVKRVLASGKPDAMALVRYDMPASKGEGEGYETHYFSPVNIPVRDAQGRIWAIIHRSSDVTEFVRARAAAGSGEATLGPGVAASAEADLILKARQVQLTNQQLQEIARIKDEFLAKASHELRTPLTLVLAPAEQLLGLPAGSLDSGPRRLVQLIQHNARRLLTMVNSFMEAARGESSAVEVKREALDPCELGRQVLEDFRPLFQDKGLHASFRCQKCQSGVLMDRLLLERLLFNLLSNAAKFTPAGGKVSVSVENEGERLKIEVSDSGIGIPLAEQGKLFQKFSRAEGARRFEGTGLGLSIAKEYAQALGGSIRLKSAPGEGSTFSLDLLAPPAAGQAPPAETQHLRPLFAQDFAPALPGKGADEEGGDGPRPKVLVAEDNLELAAFIAHNLASFCRVRQVHDGLAALREARAWRPDVLLCDIMMPGLDGLAVTRTLKAGTETATLPVVLLTALTEREDLLRGWEAGADDYLAKPFHPRELEARLKTVLKGVQWQERSERQRQDSEDLRRFTGLASDNLREPLLKIGETSARLLEKPQPGLGLDMRRELEAIRGNARRMSGLVEKLTLYTSLEGPAERVPADLNEVAAGVLKELEPAVHQCGAQVELGALPRLRVDPARIALVFRNLLDNALKFARPGVAPRVRLEARPEGREWVFCVQDEGIGFRPEQAEQLFVLFRRLQGQDPYPGHGLGLALCRRAVESHGGRIWAQAQPGRGSRFCFSLPAELMPWNGLEAS